MGKVPCFLSTIGRDMSGKAVGAGGTKEVMSVQAKLRARDKRE
ncbi:hypothetical protein OXB_0710 [Bacillus sp. OxB-1]|nr:hypothetical protein [Bacillus sp. OxB-1]BAQ09182.1 hypothetical protein OXB_0710 [Bacillus sp. OxB-1]